MAGETGKTQQVTLKTRLSRSVPILDWGRRYTRATLGRDLVAAVIVTIMLVPQSLAYAMLAGLPAEAGIYASIVPIILYAMLGSSRTLAVGPVAVVSLMTAASISEVAAPGSAGYATAALTLAALSGAMLIAMGALRLGFLANFLSHPVIAGFITASGILIAASQIKHLLGIPAHGHTLPEILGSLGTHLNEINPWTVAIGLSATAFLLWVRKGLKPWLIARGLPDTMADLAAKAGPVLAVVVSTLLVWALDLSASGVAIVGDVPRGTPPLTMPGLSVDLLRKLAGPALLISIIGFVESISVAQTLAAKRRERIDPDQELIGLGAANLGAAFTGGYPVTGGFSRSVVNFDAGAQTPAAGAFTALGLLIAALALTPLIHFLPTATLAATIVVAVLSLVDLSILPTAWRYARPDFIAVAATIALTLLAGVETGVTAGVILSVGLHLYKTSKPHIAEIGLVPGTQHFRNITRHNVTTHPHLLMIRIDESLYFANARFLEDDLLDRLAGTMQITDVVLMASAVNEIDLSALHILEELNRRMAETGIRFHLSEVKGPVMDRLSRSQFIDKLSGDIFLSQYDAYDSLATQADHTA